MKGTRVDVKMEDSHRVVTLVIVAIRAQGRTKVSLRRSPMSQSRSLVSQNRHMKPVYAWKRLLETRSTMADEMNLMKVHIKLL